MAEKTIKIVCSDEGMRFISDEEWSNNELRGLAAAFGAVVAKSCADEEKSEEEHAKDICEIIMYAISEGLLDDAQEIEDGGEENV